MDHKNHLSRPNAQQKYRRAQTRKGFIRFELQVREETKKRFDQMVHTRAQELPSPWDPRARLAKARALLFDELTQQVAPRFENLIDEITQLKAEIEALSPQFNAQNTANTAIPRPIAALEDNPQTLKQLLSQLYQENQTLKTQLNQCRRLSSQYEQLYEATARFNKDLQDKLKAQ